MNHRRNKNNPDKCLGNRSVFVETLLGLFFFQILLFDITKYLVVEIRLLYLKRAAELKVLTFDWLKVTCVFQVHFGL